jgi:hypothetical protein
MKFTSLVIVIGAFRGKKNAVVPKEISFVGVDENGDHWKGSYVFKEPHPEDELSEATRRTNSWISKNLLGGVKWEDGNISHIFWMELVRDVCSNVCSEGLIFIKGSEHTKLLRSILPNHLTVYDLDTLACPKVDDIECIVDGNLECIALCGLPNHGMKICSMGKAIRYALWWGEQNREKDRLMYAICKEEHDTQAEELSTLIEKFAKLSLNVKDQEKELKQWKQELSQAEQKQKIAGHVLASSIEVIEGYTKMPGGYLLRNVSDGDGDDNDW